MQHQVKIENSILYFRRSQLVAWCEAHCDGDFFIPNPDTLKSHGADFADEEVLDSIDMLSSLNDLTDAGSGKVCPEPALFDEEGDAVAFKMYMQNELQETAETLKVILER